MDSGAHTDFCGQKTHQLECQGEHFQNGFKTQESWALYGGSKAHSQKQGQCWFSPHRPRNASEQSRLGGERTQERKSSLGHGNSWQLPSHLLLKLTQVRNELERGTQGQLLILPKEQHGGAQRALRLLVHRLRPNRTVSGGHHPGGSRQSITHSGKWPQSAQGSVLMHLKLGVF